MTNNRQLWQSQNFLKRPEFVGKLVDRAGITPDDFVVEIGPGKGIITRQLEQRAGHVVAVEVDRNLAARLRNDFQGSPKVEIVEEDFFNWKLPDGKYKVVSNIPFNITTDVVHKLTGDKNSPSDAYLVMQDKAADRFEGKPKANQTSVLLKLRFDVSRVAKIARREFVPTPGVDAVFEHFRKREEPLIPPEQEQSFRDFVIHGFNQWQPTVMDSFEGVFSSKQRRMIVRELVIKDAKPSDLLAEQWIELFNRFDRFVPDEKKRIIAGAEKRQGKKHKKHTKWHRTRYLKVEN